jgi:hypothetical protein
VNKVNRNKVTLLAAMMGIILAASALFSNVQAAPAVKTLRVTNGGLGTFACSVSTATDDETSSRSAASSGIQMAVTADKITGKISGKWQIVSPGFDGPVASGDIIGGKMKADSFRLSGVETFSFFGNFCNPTLVPVTFTGQCGTDVAITFKGEVQQPGLSLTQTAGFIHVSVACTK